MWPRDQKRVLKVDSVNFLARILKVVQAQKESAMSATKQSAGVVGHKVVL